MGHGRRTTCFRHAAAHTVHTHTHTPRSLNTTCTVQLTEMEKETGTQAYAGMGKNEPLRLAILRANIT